MKNPLHFASYEQTFQVCFGSPDAAQRAQARIAPLPAGKKIAFTTRWDDSNPRHLDHARVLAANGLHGTFLLNDVTEETAEHFFRKAKELGSCFGNHGSGHPLFPHRTPNDLFVRVALHQAQIESMLDTVSVSLTLPCGRGGRYDLCPEKVKARTGELLNRAGIYSYPETFPETDEFLCQTPDRCFGTHLFRANDFAPDPELFRAGFEACREKGLGDPDRPRVTFGVHTWQSDAGFRTLSALYAEIAGRPEIWYCTENEYAAYRYNFYHAVIEKTAVEDCCATFRIRRFDPAETGHASELAVRFSEKPVSAPEGVILPESAGYEVPAKIDRTRSGEDSRKFPGLCVTLEKQEGANLFRIVVRNSSPHDLERMSLRLILPLKWKTGVHRIEVPLLKAGAAFGRLVDPGETDPDPLFEQDPAGADLRTDFTMNGTRGRIHTIVMFPYVERKRNVPRDVIRLAGPFPAGEAGEDVLVRASRGERTPLVFRRPEPGGYADYAFIPYGFCETEEERAAYAEETDRNYRHGACDVVLALDFIGGTCDIALEPEKTHAFWIDGVRYAAEQPMTHVTLERKLHHLIVHGKAQTQWAIRPNGYVCGVYDAETGTLADCREIS